jgi:hypothetical protein
MNIELDHQVRGYLRASGYSNTIIDEVVDILTKDISIQSVDDINEVINNYKNLLDSISKIAPLDSDMKKFVENIRLQRDASDGEMGFEDYVKSLAHIVAISLKEQSKTVVRQGHELLKVITRRHLNYKQLSIFSDEDSLEKQKEIELFNKKINEILAYNKEQADKSITQVIDLPTFIEEKIPPDTLKQITRDFSINELKALHAINGLINKSVAEKKIKYVDELDSAILNFDLSEYYELFGLTKKMEKDGKMRYGGRSREQAKKALLELHNREFVMPYEYEVENKKTKKRTRGVKIRRLIDIKSFEQTEEYDKETFRTTVSDNMQIIVDGIFLKGLQRNYFNVPKYLNREIVRALGGKRASPAIQFFIMNLYAYAQKVNSEQIEMKIDTLISVMRLENYLASRQKARIEERINQAITCAIDMGILKSYEETSTTWGERKFVFYLNEAYFKERSWR